MIKRRSDIAHPSSGYGRGFFEWIHIFFIAVVIVGILNCALSANVFNDGNTSFSGLL